MSALDARGLSPIVGARIYTDPLTRVERFDLPTPEEEAVQFLLDGLGVGSIRLYERMQLAGRETLQIAMFAQPPGRSGRDGLG